MNYFLPSRFDQISNQIPVSETQPFGYLNNLIISRTVRWDFVQNISWYVATLGKKIFAKSLVIYFNSMKNHVHAHIIHYNPYITHYKESAFHPFITESTYHSHPAPTCIYHPTDPTDAHTKNQSSKEEHTETHQSK